MIIEETDYISKLKKTFACDHAHGKPKGFMSKLGMDNHGHGHSHGNSPSTK